ncbi:MAG: SdrD B-like domain-containing protein, partial [Verrucomicrobiota bacterium]
MDLVDLLPPGVSILPGSVSVQHPPSREYVLDRFETTAYNNNDGSMTWNGNWAEHGDGGDPAAGKITIENGVLRFLDADRRDGVFRSVDLSGADRAVLSFAWRTVSLEEELEVFVSADGTNPFISLQTLSGANTYGTSEYDISAYMTASTTIRIRNVLRNRWEADDEAYFDFVRVDAYYPASTNLGGSASVLAGGVTLQPGRTLTATFDAVYPSLAALAGSVTNRATYSLPGFTNAPVASFVNPVPAELGNRVWEDLDGNGGQDPGEPGIANVSVQIYDESTNLMRTAVTDANGLYGFTNLYPSNVLVEFLAPAGYVFTVEDAGPDEATDSDAFASGFTAVRSLSPTERDQDLDAGLYRPATIGNFAWEDLNNNGLQDPGEPGLPNVRFNLYDGSSNMVSTVLTDGSGVYSMSGLPPGGYTMEVEPPVGAVIVAQNQGADDSVDNDFDGLGRTLNITLLSADMDSTCDAGFFFPAELGDFVWHDLNADGIHDPGEPGLSNVTVRLLNGTNVVATTQTDAVGIYAFTGLAPGDYAIEVLAPAGMVFSPEGEDSLVNSLGVSGLTNLISGAVVHNHDAGLFLPASVGGLIWEDIDGDGLRTPGEPGLSNVTVHLYDTTSVILASTTTDANGIYQITRLTPGDFLVEIVPLPGYQPARPPIPVRLSSGEFDNSIDGGLYRPLTIGNFIWDDLDGNGMQGVGEPGLPGVTAHLLNVTNGVIATTVSDAGGQYQFTNQAPGV